MSDQNLAYDMERALASVGRRVKTHDAILSVKVPGQVKEILKDIAKDKEVTYATVVRWAIGEYLTRRSYT